MSNFQGFEETAVLSSILRRGSYKAHGDLQQNDLALAPALRQDCIFMNA